MQHIDAPSEGEQTRKHVLSVTQEVVKGKVLRE